jgi:hypothetical protein
MTALSGAQVVPYFRVVPQWFRNRSSEWFPPLVGELLLLLPALLAACEWFPEPLTSATSSGESKLGSI